MAIEIAQVAVILLAGGRATRFGADKLAQPLDGMPLAFHAAHTLAAMPFARHVAVIGPTRLDFAALGFDEVRVATGTPMSGSLAAGIAAVDATWCDACLVALADMPLVPTAHFVALLHRHAGEATATAIGDRRMVPAVFARAAFPRLLALEGDRGAAALLRGADAVMAEQGWLVDVDTQEDLARLKARRDR